MHRYSTLLGTAAALVVAFGAVPALKSEDPMPRAAIEDQLGADAPAFGFRLPLALRRAGSHDRAAVAGRSFQGGAPVGMAITKDGRYAYVAFGLSEDVFKIRLSDLAVVATIDLSAFFPGEFQRPVLDVSEKKLFVYARTLRKLLVIDTDAMSLIHTMHDYPMGGIVRSQFGARLITWNGGHDVWFLDTNTFAVTQQSYGNLFIGKIEERPGSENKWYVAAQTLPGGQGPLTVGEFDHVTKSWDSSVSFPTLSNGVNAVVSEMKYVPNENKVYVAALGGWYPDYHAYGWVWVVDLTRRQVNAIPIDGGAGCLEASASTHRLYVGTGWPVPADNNLLVLDTQSDSILGRIPLGKTKYNWNHTQMSSLEVDPANPDALYATSVDGNALMKVRLDSLTLERVLVLNQEDVSPQFFAKRPTQDSGYILLHSTTNAIDLNSGRATVDGLVTLPVARTAYYDVALNSTGRMYIAQGERILELNASDMSLLATHALAQGLPAVWQIVLSRNEKMLYSVAQARPADGSTTQPSSFLAINTSTFQVDSRVSLGGTAGAAFASRPYEVPDQGKVYVLGGLANGPVTIDVIETSTHSLMKRITFDQPGLLGVSAGPNYPFAYDASSHTLFVGATHVVLAIDTQTDTIRQVIRLADSAKVIGLEPSQLTYINAAGLVYSPRERCLYIAHLDRSYISIFDLVGNRFLPRLIPLKGYFPRYLFANQDFSTIYSLNFRSDNVSVINTITKAVENVIDLHEYVPVVSPGISEAPPLAVGPATVLSPGAGTPHTSRR